MKKQCKSC